MTTRFPQKPTPAPSQRNEGTWLALILLLGVAGGLIALVSLVIPDIIGLVLVLAIFGGFVALHYFTWGLWLSQMTAQPPETQHTDAEETTDTHTHTDANADADADADE